MAGDWIKMRTNLRTHPKVARMASALKADRLRVIGGLHAVWCLFDEHSIDGRLEGYTVETLDDELRWPGFSAAMITVEWLEECGDSLCTPRFDEHNGQSAKRRAQEAERKRNERKASASDADKKRTREEKRREEKIEEQKPLGTSVPSEAEELDLAGGGADDQEEDEDDADTKQAPGYSADFEHAWSLYPARFGGNPKRKAFHAWSARLKSGSTAADMIAGVQRYVAHCASDGKIGTKYVMQAATFFGPDEHFLEKWPPKTTAQPQSKMHFTGAQYGPSSDPAALSKKLGIPLTDDLEF